MSLWRSRSKPKSKIKPKASLVAIGGGYYAAGTENLKRFLPETVLNELELFMMDIKVDLDTDMLKDILQLLNDTALDIYNGNGKKIFTKSRIRFFKN